MTSADSQDALAWLQQPIAEIHQHAAEAARQRQTQLTKPAGSLGQLENLAIRLAGMQGLERPRIGPVRVAIFAADHGIVEEKVSLYPAAVTAEMVRNFARGGAAISVLAQEQGAQLQVVNLGTLSALEALPGVLDRRIAAGTANFAQGPAMTRAQLAEALAIGRDLVTDLNSSEQPLFIGGEMGIGNTTSAAALACALLKAPAYHLAGPGTGLDPAGVTHKAQVIDKALRRHHLDASDPLHCMQSVAGFEIAALCGAYLHAAQRGVPVLVDGFICTVAAMAATRLNPRAADWFLYAHQSAEPGYQVLIQALDVHPLLNLHMRLGEGSGAAVALSLLRHACALHGRMATFAEAAVSTANTPDAHG